MFDILQHDEHLAPRACSPANHPSPKLGDFASIFDVWNGLGSSQSDDDTSDRTLTDSELDDTSTSVESVDSAVAAKNKEIVARGLAVGGLFGGLDFAEVAAAGISSTKYGSDSEDEDEDGDEHDGVDTGGYTGTDTGADADISDDGIRAERTRTERKKVERSIKARVKAELLKAERIKAERMKAERIKAKRTGRVGSKKDQRLPDLNPRSPPFLPSLLSPVLMATPTYKTTPSFTHEQDYGGLFKHFSLYSPMSSFAPVVIPSIPQHGRGLPMGTVDDMINPLYWASSQQKMAIVETKLQREYDIDSAIRKKPGGKPIHVFVDLSNIVIGFYMRMRALRNMPPGKRLAVMPPFFFHALARIIERGRPAARKVTAGSVHDSGKRSDWPQYMDEAEALGYEMNILSRVSRQTVTAGTPTTPQSPRKRNGQHKRQKSGGERGTTVYNESGSEESAREEKSSGPSRMGEQAVDEILQLKMCHSVLDHKAGTIVLATGDAAEAEFSDGFLRHVERAMSHGWRVELVSWTSGISKAWRELERRQKKGSQHFRIIELDTYAEELLGIFAE
ncbi:hypothetical protein CMQ_6240 [Grosmannia clavigera kw1407]|uniref:Uncharacterized protein n=1 Tax=Grosmannia clavigera (strain kw1407 / UAMH 11150) TaxID=655863 RepID=F0XLG6_GROCL|nr:uncharacterized protein CMQ_6240 [Grosmannia clavigera kw1407]EFX01298.1 hypothetical protein CMQ_6240 [Grosmannia clavigera kw1407]